MATRSPYVLLDGTFVGATDTTLYTAPTGERLTIMKAIAVNTDTSTRSLKVHRVETGSSVGDEKILQPETNIPPGGSIVLDNLIGAILEPGDFLSGIASTASKVTVQIFASRYIS